MERISDHWIKNDVVTTGRSQEFCDEEIVNVFFKIFPIIKMLSDYLVNIMRRDPHEFAI